MFTRHPESNELIERKLEVHKDKTLKFATQEAYRVSVGVALLWVELEICSNVAAIGPFTSPSSRSMSTGEV